jgi:hypothetical protein
VTLTGLGSAVLAVLRVVISCMGSGKEIGQRRITLVAASSENCAESEENDHLLNTDMRCRFLLVLRHFDRQLQGTRVFTASASSCLQVWKRSLCLTQPRRPAFDTELIF